MAWTSSTAPRGSFVLAGVAERACAAGLHCLAGLERPGFATGLRIAAGLHLAMIAASVADGSVGPAVVLSGLLLAVMTCLPSYPPPLSGFAASDLLRADEHEATWPVPACLERHAGLASSDCDTPSPHRPQSPTQPTPGTWADLTARISHDLRTPLNAIIGFSEMMDAEVLGPVGNARYREYLAHIRDSGTMLLKSTEDTLALIEMLGQAESLPAGPGVDLAAIIRDIAAPSADLSRLDDAEVIGDRRVLRQVVTNLIGAARQKAGPAGKVAVSARTEGTRVVLAVRVTGKPPLGPADAGHLSICLARTLLEMQGAELIVGSNADGKTGDLTAWQAVTVLDRAVQADFFDLG